MKTRTDRVWGLILWAVLALLLGLAGGSGAGSEPPAPAPSPPAVAAPAAAKPAPAAPTVEAPAELTLDLGGGVTMKLVLIRPGKFTMGEGAQEHEVTISKPFYMGATEVTQAQYEAILKANPSLVKGPTNPVQTVSWDAATDFCRKLSAKTGKAVRLPTEAEWEYACRAGSTTRFCFGDVDEGLADYGWSLDNGRGKTQPVGQKKPNAWGLYDMHGNVCEWCADWYGEYPNGPVTDPQGPAAGYDRVLRGGCVYFNSYNCRAAYRGRCAPGMGTSENGIRVVVSVSK